MLRNGALIRFVRTTNNPIREQEDILLRILKRHRNTEYGQRFKFSEIKNIAEFQKNVPTVEYTNIQKYIERMKKGENNILTKDKVLFFATSSGTTNTPKFIPITKQRMRLFRKEFTLWSILVLKNYPKILKGKLLYFAAAGHLGDTEAGIPHGNITGYQVSKLPMWMRKKMVLPADIYNLKDFDEQTKKIALLSLTKNITQLGFASPIQAILFCDYIKENRKELLKEIKKKSERKAKRLKNLDDFRPINIWPDLMLVNCIKSDINALYLQTLKEKIGKQDIEVIDPGIYASEGRVTFSLLKAKKAEALMAANFNFFEFKEKDVDGFKEPVTIDKIKKGKEYLILITTNEGLYRYNIGDIIRVVGFKKKLPIVEYVDRDKYINMVGENMSEGELLKAVQNSCKELKIDLHAFTAAPYIQSPTKKPRYELLIEPKQKIGKEKALKLLTAVEKRLQQNVLTYKKARNEFGRLDSPIISIVKRGSYNKLDKSRVLNSGQTKPINVSKDPKFRKKLEIEESFSHNNQNT